MSNKKSLVNPITARWLEADGSLVPPVDCDRCTLGDVRPEHAQRWRSYKCCTFQPFVPNFLCGAMIAEGLDPLAISPAKAVLQPLGVLPVAEFRELYLSTDEDLRGEAHLCSYYDLSARRCRIWSHRPGECSLFYCTTDANRDARDELSQRAFALESVVAQMALLTLGYSELAVDAQVIELNDPSPGLVSMEGGAARALYSDAWNWVRGLPSEEVLSWVDFARELG